MQYSFSNRYGQLLVDNVVPKLWLRELALRSMSPWLWRATIMDVVHDLISWTRKKLFGENAIGSVRWYSVTRSLSAKVLWSLNAHVFIRGLIKPLQDTEGHVLRCAVPLCRHIQSGMWNPFVLVLIYLNGSHPDVCQYDSPVFEGLIAFCVECSSSHYCSSSNLTFSSLSVIVVPSVILFYPYVLTLPRSRMRGSLRFPVGLSIFFSNFSLNSLST